MLMLQSCSKYPCLEGTRMSQLGKVAHLLYRIEVQTSSLHLLRH